MLKRKPVLAYPTAIRPEDVPLGSLESRAAVRAWLLQTRKRIQMVISVSPGCNGDIVGPPNLETSECSRQIWRDGTLFELVGLDGAEAKITEAELQAFIDRHPIKRNDSEQLEP